MKLAHLITSMLWLMGICELQAQEWTQKMQQPNVKLQDVKKSFDTYWKNRPYEKGKGYKPYKRWEYFWSQRLMPDGSIPPAGMRRIEWNKYLQKHPEVMERRKMRTKENLIGNWVTMGPDSSRGGHYGIGRINCVAFHPTDINTFYAGTPAGGLWRTTNGGNSWSNLTDDLPIIGVSSLVIHPTNPNLIYMATGDGDGRDTYSIGVLKSTDGGATWNNTGLNWTTFRNRGIYKLVMHPDDPNILMVATSVGIYKTSDAGANWTRTQVGYFYDLEFKPGDPTIVYAGGTNGNMLSGNQVFKSSNTGDSWSKRTNFGGRLRRIALAVSPANPEFLAVLAGAQNNGFGGFYTSTNSGNTFNLIYDSSKKNLLGWTDNGSDVGGQAWYDLTLAISPIDADIITVGGISNWRSTDGGASWTVLNYWRNLKNPHADKHFLAYHPLQTEVMFEGNDGGIYKSLDGGTSWTELTKGMAHTQFYRLGVSQSDPNYIIAGAQDNGIKLKKGPDTWADMPGGGDGVECFIDPNNKEIYYYSLQQGKAITRVKPGDGARISNNLPAGAAGSASWVTPLAMDPGNSSNILYGCALGLFRSTDQGDTWTSITENHPLDTTINGIKVGASVNVFAVAPTQSDIIYAVSGIGIYRTSDANHWVEVTNNLPLYGAGSRPRVNYIAISPSDPNTVWISLSGYHAGQKVYKTTNGGNSWTNISGTLPNVPVNCITHDDASGNESLYIGTDLGVFYRNNDLGDWQTFDNGLPNTIVNELEIQKSTKKLRAATYGRGVWESDLYGDANASPLPVITSFTPVSGPIGTSVTIQGNNFTGVTAVKFNGALATGYNVTSSSQIVVTVPNGATTGKISVVTSAGTANSNNDFIVTTTSNLQLSLTDFTPKVGPIGTEVTITGTNFSSVVAENLVKFNGTNATVNSATATELKVTVSAGTTTGKITVSVGGETVTSTVDFNVTTNNTDLVITDFNPKSGVIGTNVTITGVNFDAIAGNNLVKFNGTSAVVTTATTTQLQVTVPDGATTGKLSVTVGNQTDTSTAVFTVTENPNDPAIADFTPKEGAKDTVVTIIGNNFDTTKSNNEVQFNGAVAEVIFATNTQLKVIVPAEASTGKIAVTVAGITATSNDDFTVLGDHKVAFDIKPAKVITPNGDLINDTWQITGIERFNDYQIKVFSKAGQVVYQTSTYNNPWDGTSRGKPLAPGIYYYHIQLSIRGVQERKTGYVTIIR
ncbi:MAG TPA: hypothetical protein DCS93_26840 [Microscillaceae bacterium]|nr:hypothetical protein [Microscillaceae bacterium]